MLRVKASPELQAAAVLFQRAPLEVQRAVRQESKAFVPVLQRAIAERAVAAPGSSKVEQRLAAGAKLTVTQRGLVAVVGSGAFRTGVPAERLVGGHEFGSNGEKVTTYMSRRGGVKTSPRSKKRRGAQAFEVTRHVTRQLPKRDINGRFVFPAVADTTPRLVGMWVRAVAVATAGDRA